LTDRRSEIAGRIRIEKKSGVVGDFGQTGLVTGDNRTATLHSLNDGETKALGVGRLTVEGGEAKEARKVRIRDETGKSD